MIDAGHGGTDNGASSTRGYEKTYTLDTAFRLRRLLQADDIPVVLTRTTDDFVQLEERAHFGDRYTDFLFVSIHFNSATPQARGIETYVCTPRGAASTSSEGELRQSDFQRENGNGEDALNALLGHLVHDEVVKLNPGDIEADRGFKRARFVVLRENSLPSLLVEGGFLTNRIESAAIDQGAYRQKLAQAIDDGIDAFLRATGSPIAPAVVKPAVPVAPPRRSPGPRGPNPGPDGARAHASQRRAGEHLPHLPHAEVPAPRDRPGLDRPRPFALGQAALNRRETAMKNTFLDKLLHRIDRVGADDLQNYLQQLAREKGFLETIFNSLQEGILVVDAAGRILYANHGIERLLGTPPEETLHQPVAPLPARPAVGGDPRRQAGRQPRTSRSPTPSGAT